MGAITKSAQVAGSQSGTPTSLIGLLLRYGALIVVDALALLLIYNLASDGIWELAIVLFIITLFVNVVNLVPGLVPLRWMSPALALMGLMVAYPIIYTVYVAFTNYGDGHLLTRQQVIERLGDTRFLPEDGVEYDWVPYQNSAGQFGFWLTAEDGSTFFLTGNEPLRPVSLPASGELPEEIDGFVLLPRAGRIQALDALGNTTLGPEDAPLTLTRTRVAALAQRYIAESPTRIVDQVTGTVYVANDEIGFFMDMDGYLAALAENPETRRRDFYLTTPTFPTGAGYRVVIGFTNFERFLTSPAISGPLVSIFIWTIVFALVSVLSTFSVGLLIALLLQADTPGKKLFRTLLIVPYAIPALIAVATWRGMLNPNLGIIGSTLGNILGFSPPIFSDPTWARMSILLINLWLGYPYFMLVCSGALAAIPRDMYEAAEVDGASAWAQFRFLTLPMLLIAIGPLLIASFTFNFNNFVIIDAFAEGGPPMVGTTTPAGHTDILISYAYRLAFGSGRGADFGLASAITIIIFAIVAFITLFQFRFTRQWEKVSENV